MRTSKTNLRNWDCILWILSFAASLMVVLMVMSRPWFFKEEEQFEIPLKNVNVAFSKGKDYPPILAYWISGTKGDSKRMVRLLKAVYHPRNHYLLQLDAESSDRERRDLLVSIQSQSLFAGFGNVDVVGKNYGINRQGSSALAAMLHAAALLLKLNKNWDWFISLTPFDYPIITQDDLLHGLSFLPRDVNFIHYSSKSDWEKRYNLDQVVIDPSLYLGKNSDLMYAVETRTKPDAFNIFGGDLRLSESWGSKRKWVPRDSRLIHVRGLIELTNKRSSHHFRWNFGLKMFEFIGTKWKGSPWMILTREVAEYCVQGWENLPRKLLMYFNNVAFPLQFYFHTVICNSPYFQNKTSADAELVIRYVSNTSYDDQMVAGGAAFATPFKDGDSQVLNMIDKWILNRSQPDGVVAGNWCSDSDTNETDSCSSNGSSSTTTNIDSLKAGPNGRKLAFLLSQFQFTSNNPCHL